jgi:hypothetical protein
MVINYEPMLLYIQVGFKDSNYAVTQSRQNTFNNEAAFLRTDSLSLRSVKFHQ